MSWVARDDGCHGHERDAAQAGLNEAAGREQSVYGDREASSLLSCRCGIVEAGCGSCCEPGAGWLDDCGRDLDDLRTSADTVAGTTTPAAALGSKDGVSFPARSIGDLMSCPASFDVGRAVSR